jgi:ZIP family zinc transporter
LAHNGPEGAVSFVGALANSHLGFGLAFAIALHNVFEAVASSVPIYFATGSKWKGFAWGALSGVSEPVGALLTWLLIRQVPSPALFGGVFAFVAGMMVFIALRELLPTAHKYDPGDRYVSGSLFVGMAVIALSMVLFEIGGE